MTIDKDVSDFCSHKQTARTVKVEDLTGEALDWAVATAESIQIEADIFGKRDKGFWIWQECENGETEESLKVGSEFSPSTSWDQAGPIIDREKISMKYDHAAQAWLATKTEIASINLVQRTTAVQSGSTATEAAMRCYVAAKLGSIIEIPEGLEL